MSNFKIVEKCRMCGSKNIRPYLNLGKVPLANSLPKTQDDNNNLEIFPVEVFLCEECYSSFLSIVIDPTIMFTEYCYKSSISETFKKHCYDLGVKLKSEFDVCKCPLVMDIASNDGCLLDQFRLAGFKRLMGVEPARNLTETYLERNLIVMNYFFNSKMVSQIDSELVAFVTAQNVMAHIDDLSDFIIAVKRMLIEKGVFVGEFPYFRNIIKYNQFDTIYHEHLSYLTFSPLVNLFESQGLPIFRVEQTPIHGGSLRIFASRGHYTIDDSVDILMNYERNIGLNNFEVYEKFSERVHKHCKEIRDLIFELKSKDIKVSGYGASAKGISLLNYSGVGDYALSYIVDDTPLKQNRFTPGSCVPIVDFSKFETDRPDYILLLAWNFADELIKKTKHINSKYIIPIPEVKIL